jgi:hypothetical protein
MAPLHRLGSGAAAVVIAVPLFQNFRQHIFKVKMGGPLSGKRFPPLCHLEQVFPLPNRAGAAGRLPAAPRVLCVLL